MYGVVARGTGVKLGARVTKCLGVPTHQGLCVHKEDEQREHVILESTPYSLPKAGDVTRASKGLFVQNPNIKRITGSLWYSVRYAHTDNLMSAPNFDKFRKSRFKNPYKAVGSTSGNEDRDKLVSKNFSYVVCAVGGWIPLLFLNRALFRTRKNAMKLSKEVQALASCEIDLATIPEGTSILTTWRGKPLFVKHRTADQIAVEETVKLSTLPDPQHARERYKKPEWIIVLGVCTHLGCVPVGDSGDFNGFFCPCHGSHYDTAGRIRKGPAPKNLEIPPHSFPSDDIVLVGVD